MPPAMAGDFDPGFSFDFGGSAALGKSAVQAPWELTGALEEARREQASSRATSIDHKIQQRLGQRKAGKAGGQKRPRGDEDSEDDDGAARPADLSDVEDSDSEDEPLPGEESGDSEDSDSELAAGGSDDEEEEEDDEEGDEAGSSGSEDPASELAGGSLRGEEDDGGSGDDSDSPLGAAARQGNAGASDQEDDDDDDEDEEEPGAKRRRLQAEQQLRQQRLASGSAASGTASGTAAKAVGGKAAAALAGKRRKGALDEEGEEGFFASAPSSTSFAAATFSDLNLSRPLLRACTALGYTKPTPIQAACIPLALLGRDICGSAITGSGKTAAFALPALERLLYRPRQIAATYVLVLAPTRELAVQVHSMISKLAQFTDIQAVLVVGGLSVQVQAAALRKSPEVVVATPGRLIDHLRNTHSVGLEDLQVLVLDEADRLLEMGFKEEIQEIVKMAPRKRQTLLFSATFGEGVQRLAALSLRTPVRLAADATAAAPSELTQEVVRLKGVLATQKEAVLLALCGRSLRTGRTIVFFRTRARAHRFKILFGLAKLPPAAELHGDMTQAARLESLEKFRCGDAFFLLATDVAARGLDIIGVQAIVNYDAPRSLETYLHRIGRTARAGKSGMSVTLIEDNDRKLLAEVIKRVRKDIKQRIVPPEAVAQWQARVERYEDDVQAVMYAEKEERGLRKAEMETNKMVNMIEHEAEIKARPARTWFQTERQKKDVANAAWDAAQKPGGGEHGGGGAADQDERGPEGGKTAKAQKATDKSKKRADRKQQAKGDEDSQAKRRTNKSAMAEEQADGRSAKVRGIKTRVRTLVQQQGLSTAAATKIATRAVTGVNNTKKKKKTADGGKAAGGGGGEEGLFSGDGTGRSDSGNPNPPVAPAVRSGADAKKRAMSKAEAAKSKRGGKGAKAFKSKKKYKRR